MVAKLLAAGVDKDSADAAGRTALHLAVQNDARHAIVAALVEAGADIEAESSDGGTPLSRALEAGCGEVVRILLEAGARES